jgi:hypothetical protein
MSIGVASIEFVLANLLQNARSGKKALHAALEQRALHAVAEGIRLDRRNAMHAG